MTLLLLLVALGLTGVELGRLKRAMDAERSGPDAAVFVLQERPPCRRLPSVPRGPDLGRLVWAGPAAALWWTPAGSSPLLRVRPCKCPPVHKLETAGCRLLMALLVQILQHHCISGRPGPRGGGGQRAAHRHGPHRPPQPLPLPPPQPGHGPAGQTSQAQPVRAAHCSAQQVPSAGGELPCQWLGGHCSQPG